jgi:hypothetical protein
MKPRFGPINSFDAFQNQSTKVSTGVINATRVDPPGRQSWLIMGAECGFRSGEAIINFQHNMKLWIFNTGPP